MLRYFFIFFLMLSATAVWSLHEHPAARALSEGPTALLNAWFPIARPHAAALSPAEVVPFVSESRSLSVTYEPVSQPFAPALSVPTAHASVVVDAQTGKVLYAHKASDRRQVASLTKLFTALIVVERLPNLDQPISIDEEAISTEGTRVGCPRSGFCNGERLAAGETLSAHALLQAALMNSANDAAIALGKHIGGTQDGFAAIMNERARQLGMENSHFCTPSGLEIDGEEERCYSSAADIALATTEALKHPVLWDIMRHEKTVITALDGSRQHEIFNTDQLLGQMPNLVGTKTGFTPLAGYSLVAVAADPSGLHRVVAVVLNDPYRWQSVRSMLDWSFAAFQWI